MPMRKRLKRKVWKPIRWVKKSRLEYAKYRKTGDSAVFAQSGEKLWNALTLHIDDVAGKKLTTFSEMRKAVRDARDPELANIFEDAYHLHTFFYRGYTDDINFEKDLWKRVNAYLKKKVG